MSFLPDLSIFALATARRGAAALPALPLKVVAEGDSITATTSPASYANRWIAANAAVASQNFAIGGATLGFPADRTLGAGGSNGGNSLWRRVDDVLAAAPSIVTIGIGANDGLGTDAPTYYARILEYANYLRGARPGLKVMVCSNFPRYVAGDATYTANYNAKRYALAALFRAGVGTDFEAFADFANHPTFTDAYANGAGIPDGLHPGQTAHDIARDIYSAALNALVTGATGTTPSAFAFTDDVNVELSTVTTGAPIIVAGMSPTAQASVTATALASVGQGAFSANPGNVRNGDAVRPRVTSSGSNLTAVDNDVTIGGTADRYSATTKAANPPAFAAIGTSALVSASGGTTHTISFTLPVAGRPIMGLLRGGTISSLSIKDGGNTVVATGTSRESVGSTPRHLVSFNNTIPAGTYTLEVVGSNVGAITVTAWIGYLTGSNGGFTDSDKDAAYGIHNPNTLKMANPVTVAPGGLMVLFVQNNAAFNNYGTNTLVSSYTDGTNWHWFTNTATGDGAMNNASATSAGMLGASFT